MINSSPVNKPLKDTRMARRRSKVRNHRRGTFLVIGVGAVTIVALATLALPEARGHSVTAPAATQEGNNWIEYRVGGDATEEHKEADMLMCSTMDDGARFGFRSAGEWTIGVESPSASFGEHEARFELSPPANKYRDDNFRTDDRAWGDGTLVLEDGGKDPMGFSVFKGTFTIPALSADSGFSFELEGSFSCPVLGGDEERLE